MKHLLALVIPCVLAAAYAAPAHAEDTDDRFQIRLGAMNVDNDNTIRGNTLVAGNNVSVNEDFKLGGKEWEPRVDGVFRISTRQRLIFDYFKYDKDRRETLTQDLSGGGITVPTGSFIKGELKYQVATLVYDYSVIDSPEFSLGLQLGAEYAKVEANAYADLGSVFSGDVLDESEDGVAPVVGIRFTARPSEHWLFNVQGQYLNTSWGNFDDYKGDLSRANAIAEYRFTKNFGLFAGYDWFKLDVDQRGSDGLIGLKQEFKGPVAGVTFAF
ncbi:hypothetical protein [Xanthomonas hortorum]|uniref:Secreted protein n=1 Tax=Xanthomonas hortorum pv. gardneri TaxID=2754056 RepID=A0A6V7ENE8_9XANT|nr:hypothetical protein [Xanthomonas hortorum]APP79330.1 hypothetical protein BJD10_06165 [Xanthomonas hortorum pv. gardneri]EGD19222.1 Protein of unknown function (DUF732) [Xanthomonas hortorum ATCC 19865]KLA96920.1 hypothetical protein SM19410_11750 [Xanthomonas hortorum pv. gardneri]KLB02751.1 hypothetical protein SM17710_03040 [Xanthomonas hortorum pv. gardneri]KLB02863.1 hypothetical protein SM18210_12060 [Xanthomonas hortorum pv. gardneri]